MFEHILALFNGNKASVTKLPAADVQHALGALLVRTAKADKAYLFEEVEQIDQILAHRYKLNPVKAAQLRAECELLEEAMPVTADLAGILHDAIDMAERESIVAALWTVVFADGIEQDDEDALLTEIEQVLGVPHHISMQLHDIAQAKARR